MSFLGGAGTLQIEVLDKGTLGAEEQLPSSSSKERPPARFAQSAVTVPSNGKPAAPLVRLSVQTCLSKTCSPVPECSV